MTVDRERSLVRRWSASVALCWLGCTGVPVPEAVEWPSGLEGVLASWLITVDGRDAIRSMEGPFLAADGDPPKLRLTLEEDEELLFLALPAEPLLAAHPAFAVDRLDRAELVRGEESCAPSRTTAEGAGISFDLGNLGKRLYRLHRESLAFEELIGPNWADGLVMSLPSGVERCRREGEDILRAFGESGVVLSDGQTILGQPRALDVDEKYFAFSRVLRVDEDRVLALSRGAIYLFHRGRPFADEPSDRISALDVVDARENSPDFILLARVPGNGSLFLATVEIETVLGQDPRDRQTILFELEVGEEGLAARRNLYQIQGALKALVVGADGRLVAGGVGPAGALTLTSTSPGAPPSFPVVQSSALEHVIETGSARAPYALGTREGTVLLGNVTNTGVNGDLIAVSRSRLGALAAQSDGVALRLWVGGAQGELFEALPQSRQLRIELPPRSQICGGIRDECGRLAFHDRIVDSLQIDPRPLATPRLYLLETSCPVIHAIEPDLGCASPLDMEGVSQSDLGRVAALSMDLSHGYLTVGAAPGRIFELELR